jgi:hypothetical protein
MLGNHDWIVAAIGACEGVKVTADIRGWIKTFPLPMDPASVVVRISIPGVVECGDQW